MNRKTTLIAAVLVLILGLAAVALVQTNKKDSEEATGTTPPRDPVSDPDNRFKGTNPDQDAKISSRSEREVKNEALVEQYGEARTNVARHVSENVIGILDDVIEMGEAMTSGRSEWGGGQWMIRGISRQAGVELTEEQKEQANELYNDYRKRELEKTKSAVESLRSDPTTLMGMILAGDARSRGDLTEDAYADLQAANAEALGDIVNPLDRTNFRGGSPMEDESFRTSFEAILDAEQRKTYNTKMAESEDEPQSRQQTDITQMPVTDLESLDQAVGSAKQMTSGLRQMMDGLGGLRGLQPKINPLGGHNQ